ncbi:hypothetical protein AX15_002339 [Amanita polypyramis BW_CC]|nr:hypothetical protein AX15_002339 [Amanita polypyramis BW_CC]
MLRRVEEGHTQSFDILSKAHFEVLHSGSLLPPPPHYAPRPSPGQEFPPVGHPVNNALDRDHPAAQVLNMRAKSLPPAQPVPCTPAKAEPTFSSLSSPANSRMYSPCIPESPSLSPMISDAIRARSSFSSQESVEQHLTQSLNKYSQQEYSPADANGEQSLPTPTQSLSKSHIVTITDPQNRPHSLTLRQTQTWYQTKPKIKRMRKLSAVIPPSSQSGSPHIRPPSTTSSTPEWSQQSQATGPNDSQQYPYQTQAPYNSQHVTQI